MLYQLSYLGVIQPLSLGRRRFNSRVNGSPCAGRRIGEGIAAPMNGRHPRTLLVAVALAAALLASAATLKPAAGDDARARNAAAGKRPISDYPWQRRMKSAVHFARRRAGSVSFAVVDERGRVRGFHRGRRHSSASVHKAMLLVAFLQGASATAACTDPRRRRSGRWSAARTMPPRRASTTTSAIAACAGSDGAGMKRFVPNSV